MNSLICSLVVSIQERRLHNDWRLKYNDDHTPKLPGKDMVENAVSKLNKSFDINGCRFDQLLAIAESKVLIFRFLIWIQATKFILTEEGIAKSKKTKVYMKKFGELSHIEHDTSEREEQVKRGLQFYFFSNLSRRLGFQQSLRYKCY